MKIKSCKCGTIPIKETRKVMLCKIQDGGYPVLEGRYKCPKCGLYPSWGTSYSVRFSEGWKKNADVWNNFIDNVKAKNM